MGVRIAVDVKLPPDLYSQFGEVRELFKVDQRLVVESAIRHWESLHVSSVEDFEFVKEDLILPFLFWDYNQQEQVGQILLNAAASVQCKLNRVLSPMTEKVLGSNVIRLIDLQCDDLATVELECA